MFNYFFKIFKSNSFKSNPIKTLIRGMLLILLITFKVKSKFRVQYGKNFFYLNFIPLMRNGGGRGIFLYREKIETLMEFGHRFLNKGDVVIDAGANQGIFSTAFSSIVGNEGKVISIEPFYFYKDIIENNSRINQFALPTVITNVLSNEETAQTLDYSKGIGKSSIVRNFGSRKLLQIKSTTIDVICTKMELKKVDFIKLDLEGAEYLALEGGINTIQRFKPIIAIECEAKSFNKISNLLGKFKYNSFIIDKKGSIIKINKLLSDEDNIYFLRDQHLQKYKTNS